METKIIAIKGSALVAANAYLVLGADGAVLIDTCGAKDRQRVLSACQGARLRLILLTHGHFDHCQNAAFLARELGCPVGIAPGDAPLLSKGEKRRVQGKGLRDRAFSAVSNAGIRSNAIEPVEAAVPLTEGLDLAPWGLKGRIVALPGHTLGSVGVLLDSGPMFVGDAMMGVGGPTGPWCYEDPAAAAQSVARIRGLAPALVYFGHGKPAKL